MLWPAPDSSLQSPTGDQPPRPSSTLAKNHWHSVGNDHKVTYDDRPTECRTETATICETTSSIGESTTLVGSTCGNIIGCSVTNSAATSTEACTTATVTSFFVSCTTTDPAATPSCTTTSSLVTSGCEVTASTSTEFGSCVLWRTTTVQVEEPPQEETSVEPSLTSAEPGSSTVPASATSAEPISSDSAVPTSTQAPSSSEPPLPTLTGTNTEWSTPAGSTCASTATYSTCNFPGGVGTGVCVDTSSCASWAATSTAPTEPEPTKVPQEFGSKACWNEDNYPGHGDINEEWVVDYVFYACAKDTAAVDFVMRPGESHTWNTITNGTPYWFSVSWMENCVTDVEEMSVWVPSPNDGRTCYTIMEDNWRTCNNGGVGGYQEVGCLRYIFEACDPATMACHM
ncbi:hypothetical protein OQA88_10544 [Cercophora sp. LCS_1]